MTTHRVAAVAAFVLVVPLGLAAQPAAASWAPGGIATVISAGCTSSTRSADAGIDGAGVLRSFASFVGGGCSGNRIRYGARSGSTSTSLLSPYNGTVLAVAVDSTATWLLYRATDGTRLGGRTHAGAWKASNRLSSVRAGSGDLAAINGRWWAVWSEQTSSTRGSLWNARTIGGTSARTRVTTFPALDTAPALSVRSTGVAFLAFARRAASSGVREIVVFRKATPSASWSTFHQTSNGDNHEPDVLARSDSSVRLAWRHATRIVTAYKSGSITSRTLTTAGTRPRLATSGGRVFVAWTRAGTPAHVMLAEGSGDVWVERDIVPGASVSRNAAAVVARGGNATVAAGYASGLQVIGQVRPSITAFRGLGTWVDRFELESGTPTFLDPEETAPLMKAHGVKTLYLQTGKFNSDVDVIFPDVQGRWLEAAHAQGIRVVGWYFPGYGSDLDKDVRRTLAIATFESPAGQHFDALGIDIERRGTLTPPTFNTDVTTHLRRVRAGVGPAYPISAIVQAPIAMELNPDFAGFPWRSVGVYADVVQPMGYWTFRTTCPSEPRHCPYGYSRGNVDLAQRFTGLPAHEVGGIHREPAGRFVTVAEVRDFVRGTNDAGAIGGSLYDYERTCVAPGKRATDTPDSACTASFWPDLALLN
jgi:hypothetical protein